MAERSDDVLLIVPAHDVAEGEACAYYYDRTRASRDIASGALLLPLRQHKRSPDDPQPWAIVSRRVQPAVTLADLGLGAGRLVTGTVWKDDTLMVTKVVDPPKSLTVYQACGLPEVRDGKKWFSFSPVPGYEDQVRHLRRNVAEMAYLEAVFRWRSVHGVWRKWKTWKLEPEAYDLPCTLIDPEPEVDL